ncbi:MAG: hypothetical protein P4L74_03505 [Candidatus Doudnabacteria bacterium]|nr:hypothetical protein [Candidatus Doudnabacteria bacterium]
MDKNLNINISFSKQSFGALFKNLIWIFFCVFLCLLAFEGLEIRNSVGLILQLNEAPQQALPARNSVDRIDFGTYDKNLTRVQNAQSFVSPGGINYDPFNDIGTPPAGGPSGAVLAPSSTPITAPQSTGTTPALPGSLVATSTSGTLPH